MQQMAGQQVRAMEQQLQRKFAEELRRCQADAEAKAAEAFKRDREALMQECRRVAREAEANAAEAVRSEREALLQQRRRLAEQADALRKEQGMVDQRPEANFEALRREREALQRERLQLAQEAEALQRERELAQRGPQATSAEALSRERETLRQERARLARQAEALEEDRRRLLQQAEANSEEAQREVDVEDILRRERQALNIERRQLAAQAEALAEERELLRQRAEAVRRSEGARSGGPELAALQRERALMAEETKRLQRERAALAAAGGQQPRDEPKAGTGGPDQEDLREALKSAQDRLTRQTAEFQNYKSRVEAQEKERLGQALAKAAKPLLPVLDDFRRAGASAGEAAREVLAPLRRRLVGVLEKELGVRLLPSSVGKPFDPEMHEAVALTPGEAPADTVLEELEEGFLSINGEVIRPARVVVSSGPAS